jgi:hypothetical protein
VPGVSPNAARPKRTRNPAADDLGKINGGRHG